MWFAVPHQAAHYSGMGWGLEIVNRVWRHDLMMNYAAQTEAKLIFG